MNFISLNEYIRFDISNNMYDLFSSTFVYNPTINLSEYIVERDVEMRIDLIFKRIYNLEYNEVNLYIGDIDVILYINGIDNPLNIKEGMSIKYPINIGDFINFRVSNVEDDLNNVNITKDILSFPNKSTKKDKSRVNYLKNDYSLPPVVLDTPRKPVSIKDGKFSIGGV